MVRSGFLRLMLIGAAAAALGCGADNPGAGSGEAPGPPVVLSSGAFTLTIDPSSLRVTLASPKRTLLDFRADGFELGTVGSVDDETNYDPTALYQSFALEPPPADLAWLDVESLRVTSHDDASAIVSLGFPQGKTATLTIALAAPQSFVLKLTPAPGGPAVAYFRLRPHIDPAEGLYGLGEQFDDVNQRGHLRPMQIELDTSLESGYTLSHVPIPYLVGTNGWGLFVENPYPAVFSVAETADDLVEAAFGTGVASVDGLQFHVFAADAPLDLTKLYYDATAYPAIPDRWALGPWLWRDETKDQQQLESDLQTMRDRDLPHTAYWLDRPYATGVNTFDFDPQKFPDPEHFMALGHDLGFRTGVWHTPYLDEKDPATQPLRDQATANGYYPPRAGDVLANRWGRPLDLTNPGAVEFWRSQLQKYADFGIEGFKLDFAEDVLVGIVSKRNVWQFADGSDERTMHARFQAFYHQTYAAMLPPTGGFLLCRASTYGDQANVRVIWPGDMDATFARYRDSATDEDGNQYTSVGGLPATIVAGLSLGPSGFPFYGADTGGYLHSPADKELFARWFEQTALSTVMQIGNSASVTAWDAPASTGYDQELLDWYRTYTRLHLRLWPYEWTYAQNLRTDGRPIQRPLGLAYPELGVHPNDEYLFGDSLLVAPVVERGKTDRTLVLPPGRWIDWWTGHVYEGGITGVAALTVPAPLGTLPLFLAAGAIVPLLRPTIDTMAPTTRPAEVDSYATTPGILWARIAPGPASTFTVFDGAELHQEQQSGTIALSSKDGSEFRHGVVFELVGIAAKPTGVTEGGAPLVEVADAAALDQATSGWTYDPTANGGLLSIKVPPGAHDVAVTQ